MKSLHRSRVGQITNVARAAAEARDPRCAPHLELDDEPVRDAGTSIANAGYTPGGDGTARSPEVGHDNATVGRMLRGTGERPVRTSAPKPRPSPSPGMIAVDSLLTPC